MSIVNVSVKKPDLLKNFNNWISWWTQVENYLATIEGVAEIPLTYIARPHSEVTDEIRNATYDNNMDRLIAITTHDGTHYARDNATVWTELEPILIDGPGWTYVKWYEKRKGVRNAILAL